MTRGTTRCGTRTKTKCSVVCLLWPGFLGKQQPSSTPAAASFAAADGGVASSWALTLVSAAAFGVFALSLYSKADGAEARPLLVKAT